MLNPAVCAFGVWPDFVNFGGLPFGLPLGFGAAVGPVRAIFGRAGSEAGSAIVIDFGVDVLDGTTTLEPSIGVAGVTLAGILSFE